MNEAIRHRLQQVQDVLDAAPQAPCSPGTVSQNRAMIDAIVDRMIDKGQLAPPSALVQLGEFASHVKDLPRPTESRPLTPEFVEGAIEMIDVLQGLVRTRQQHVDIDEMFKAFQASADGITTPTASQPRSADVLQRYNQSFESLRSNLKRKQVAPPTPKRKRRGKVRSDTLKGAYILTNRFSATSIQT